MTIDHIRKPPVIFTLGKDDIHYHTIKIKKPDLINPGVPDWPKIVDAEEGLFDPHIKMLAAYIPTSAAAYVLHLPLTDWDTAWHKIMNAHLDQLNNAFVHAIYTGNIYQAQDILSDMTYFANRPNPEMINEVLKWTGGNVSGTLKIEVDKPYDI